MAKSILKGLPLWSETISHFGDLEQNFILHHHGHKKYLICWTFKIVDHYVISLRTWNRAVSSLLFCPIRHDYWWIYYGFSLCANTYRLFVLLQLQLFVKLQCELELCYPQVLRDTVNKCIISMKNLPSVSRDPKVSGLILRLSRVTCPRQLS